MHPCLMSHSAPSGHTVSPCAVCLLKNCSFVDTSVNSFDDPSWWHSLISPRSSATGAAYKCAGAWMRTEIEMSAKSAYDGINAAILVCDGKELVEIERVECFCGQESNVFFSLLEWKATRQAQGSFNCCKQKKRSRFYLNTGASKRGHHRPGSVFVCQQSLSSA